jgi:hypothetical protein
MIDKEEIKRQAKAEGLRLDQVEKDHVILWIFFSPGRFAPGAGGPADGNPPGRGPRGGRFFRISRGTENLPVRVEEADTGRVVFERPANAAGAGADELGPSLFLPLLPAGDSLASLAASMDSMRRRLKEEYQRRDWFILTVSHDLKTPLAPGGTTSFTVRIPASRP